MIQGRITERSLYTPMIAEIQEAGGSGVDEVSYNSQPDIVFAMGGRQWILSVKIGDDPQTTHSAFLQYLRHKDESGIDQGLLCLFPTTIRDTAPEQDTLRRAVQRAPLRVFVDAGPVKDEIAGQPLPRILERVRTSIIPALDLNETRAFSLPSVVQLLQTHVSQMMAEIPLDEDGLLTMITDTDLLRQLGPDISADDVDAVGRFLASYIFLSQIMFLRLLYTAQPHLFRSAPPGPEAEQLQRAFRRILQVNYRQIYELQVMEFIPAAYIRSTFDLIWGLAIEQLRYELAGRIFHELMPSGIRKMLAAFYTRPLAADLLANLTIDQGDETVFDPACGSGTILVSAYNRKRRLSEEEGEAVHQRFCEDEIFGADIMPFAVHLTTANLAALEPQTTLKHTQIMQEDSLRIEYGAAYRAGAQARMFARAAMAQTMDGEEYEVEITRVDDVLMNPPFTKVERGIAGHVDMERFAPQCGAEIGLWGHFLCLSDEVLRDGGTLGAVIPINLLRGTESERIREKLFSEWTPRYILKATHNYGFSEWAEYRDVLFIADRSVPPEDHDVKVALVKLDLSRITEQEATAIAESVRRESELRSDSLDITSIPLSTFRGRMRNMMWFCSGVDLSAKDRLIAFVNRFRGATTRFPEGYFSEGYRPVPRGVSSFLFLTRANGSAREQQAHLTYAREGRDVVHARGPAAHARYEIERSSLTPSLRTPIGLPRMDLRGQYDYIARAPYADLDDVLDAIDFGAKTPQWWNRFWRGVAEELRSVETRAVIAHRINPFSPSTTHFAFYSDTPISPSNMMHTMNEADDTRAKAVCALLNSVLFLANFFLLKEESTGRYINIRQYDLDEMALYPSGGVVPALSQVFDRFREEDFPCLSHQLDQRFEERYVEYREERGPDPQARLMRLADEPIRPHRLRLDFDRAVCAALGVEVSDEEIAAIYSDIIYEMLVIRALARD